MKMFFFLLLIFISMKGSAANKIEVLAFEVDKLNSEKITEVKLSEDIKLSSHFVISPKGNGSLSISNLRLKIFDNHDNGMIYGEDDASITLVDLDGDKIKELLVSGVLIHTGENETSPSIYSYFVRGYRYEKSTGEFLNILKIGNYQPDINSVEYEG